MQQVSEHRELKGLNEPDGSHGRIRRCFLTAKGQRIAEACYPAGAEVEDKLLALFDDAQRAQFAEYLRLFLGEILETDAPVGRTGRAARAASSARRRRR